MPPTSTSRADRAAAKHAREYDAIIVALHALEEALAAPAPRREQQWKKRTHSELKLVVDRLKAHCRAAESTGGVLANAEVKIGCNRSVSRAYQQHKRLIAEARELLADLDRRAGHPSLTPREVRRRAHRLASALRHHQALEADVVIDTFDRDIGGED